MENKYRPFGRFFCWILMGVLLFGMVVPAHAARTTRVNDTVYRADGLPASGTLVISWPAFTTAAGEAVAAGRMNVAIGLSGLVDVALVPNTDSTPASYYTVLIKSDELKAHMRWLVGNGNEGKMQEIESRVHRNEAQLQRMGGIGAAFGVLLTLVHLAFDYLRVHRP